MLLMQDVLDINDLHLLREFNESLLFFCLPLYVTYLVNINTRRDKLLKERIIIKNKSFN